MTTTYTRSCYGNRETVTSLSNFWSCQVVVTWPSSKVINKQISFILFILHLTETLVPLWDTLVVLFNRDTHSLCLTNIRTFIWQTHSSLYLTETLVFLFDRDTRPFIWQRHSSLYLTDTCPFIWQRHWYLSLNETLAQRHSSLYLTDRLAKSKICCLKSKSILIDFFKHNYGPILSIIIVYRGVRACVRACLHACVCVCVRVCVWFFFLLPLFVTLYIFLHLTAFIVAFLERGRWVGAVCPWLVWVSLGSF